MKVLFISTVLILFVGAASAAPKDSGDSEEAPTATGDSGEVPTASEDSGEVPTAPGDSGDQPAGSGDAPLQFSWEELAELEPTLRGCKPVIIPSQPSPELCMIFAPQFNATKILHECGGEGCTMVHPVSNTNNTGLD